MRHDIHGVQPPKSAQKIPPITCEPSAGRGHLSWAYLHAAGDAPVPAFKPKCSLEERFKPMKLLKVFAPSVLKYSFSTSGLFLFSVTEVRSSFSSLIHLSVHCPFCPLRQF